MAPSRTEVGLALALLVLAAVALAPRAERPAAPRSSPAASAPTSSQAPAPSRAERAAPAATLAPPAEPRTSIVVLRVGEGVTLASWAEKPVRFVPADLPASAPQRFRVEDARTGQLLHEGACSWPEPCRCSVGRDHAQGCAVIRHDVVARLKLPRSAPRERVTLLEGDVPVASFLLE